MNVFKDYLNRLIRFTDERINHIQQNHPELSSANLFDKVTETLAFPEIVLSSISDESVELFYKFYNNTFAGDKWLCIVIKNLKTDFFIITLYYTDSIKKGNEIWKRI